MAIADGLDISKSFGNKMNPNNRSMISDSMKIINLLQILRKNRIESGWAPRIEKGIGKNRVNMEFKQIRGKSICANSLASRGDEKVRNNHARDSYHA